MPSSWSWWLTVGMAVLSVAGCSAGAGSSVPGAALVRDPVRARAMIPAITAYLDSPIYRQGGMGAYSAADYQSGRVRWLCSVAVVEIRPDGQWWQAGMDVVCGDYERRGAFVYLEDGGDMGHVVMVLSGGPRYRVLSAAREEGVGPNPAWIDQHFSSAAAAEINGGQGQVAPLPNEKALVAFGCFPAAKGVYGGQAAESWPCQPG